MPHKSLYTIYVRKTKKDYLNFTNTAKNMLNNFYHSINLNYNMQTGRTICRKRNRTPIKEFFFGIPRTAYAFDLLFR